MAREVVSEVEINRMGISKKEVKSSFRQLIPNLIEQSKCFLFIFFSTFAQLKFRIKQQAKKVSPQKAS